MAPHLQSLILATSGPCCRATCHAARPILRATDARADLAGPGVLAARQTRSFSTARRMEQPPLSEYSASVTRTSVSRAWRS